MTEVNSTIDVRILTQLLPPHNNLSFDRLPPATTITELKHRILETLPSRPAAEAQRLIYNGRLLRDTETLRDIFGRDAIASQEPRSIHLVIRDPQASQVQPPPLNPLQRLAGQAIPTNGARVATPVSRPQSAHGARQTGFQIQVGGVPPQLLPQSPFPFGFPQNPAVMQQLALEQHRRAHEAAVRWSQQHQQNQQHGHDQQAHHAPVVSQQPQVGSQQGLQPPSSIDASQPPTSLGQGMPSTSSDNPADNGHSTTEQPEQPAQSTLPYQGHEGAAPAQGRWTFTFNSGMQPQMQPGLPAFMPSMPLMPPPFGQFPGMPFNHIVTPAQNATTQMDGSSIENMRRLQERLDQLVVDVRQAIASARTSAGGDGSRAPSSVVAQSRQSLHELIAARNAQQEQVNNIMAFGPRPNQQPLPEEDIHPLQTLNDDFRRVFRGLSEDIDALANPSGAAAAATPAASLLNNPATGSDGAATSASDEPSRAVTAYLLSGPAGPNAVVFTADGTFASTSQTPQFATQLTPSVSHGSFQDAFRALRYGNRTRPPSRNQHPNTQSSANGIAQNGDAQLPQPDQPVEQAAIAQQQLVLQQPFQPQNAQPANVGAAEGGMDLGMAPFFRALWLFIRVYGVFWFFIGGGGNSTRRTILLVVMTVGYWAYQAGLFRDQVQYLQRHWDGLIRIPDNVINQQAALPQNGAGQTQNERLQQGTFTPEEAAQRLLEERRQRDQGTWRERFRTIERALVLFAISFWPGGGERLVAERERQRREADEQRRRQAEEAIERDRAAAAAATAQESDEATQPKHEGEAIAVGDTAGPSSGAGEGSSSGVEVGASSASQVTERRHPVEGEA